jgi:hypothetical protein
VALAAVLLAACGGTSGASSGGGSPAMNFLPGTLEDGHLRTALGDVALPAEMAAKVRRAGEAAT